MRSVAFLSGSDGRVALARACNIVFWLAQGHIETNYQRSGVDFPRSAPRPEEDTLQASVKFPEGERGRDYSNPVSAPRPEGKALRAGVQFPGGERASIYSDHLHVGLMVGQVLSS